MLAGSAAQLRAKLQTNTRYLPTAAVAKMNMLQVWPLKVEV